MGCLVRMTRLLYLGLMMPNTMPGGIRHPRPRLLVLLPAVKDLEPTSQRQAKLVGCVNAGIAGGEHHVNLRRVGRSNVNTRSSKPSTASGSTAVAQALDPTVAPRVQCPCLYGPRQPPFDLACFSARQQRCNYHSHTFALPPTPRGLGAP
jgi:hypothetical protein